MCSQVLPCPLCCKPNFESIDALKISLVMVTNRPLICPICNEILFGLDKLTIHLFSHSLVMNVEEKGVKDKSEVEQMDAILNVQPSQSVESVSSPQPLKIIPQQEPPPPLPPLSVPIPQVNNSNLPSCVKCDICDFIFENKKHLSMHMNLVHAAVPTTADQSDQVPKFPCHLCNKSFKMKGSLRVHLRVVHMHGFQNICKNATSKNKDDDHSPIAIDSYSTASVNDGSLLGENNGREDVPKCAAESDNKELQLVNEQKTSPASPTMKSPWVCDICTKSFTTKYFLKKHKRLHTGEMPYACSICGKTFTFQQSYHKHLLYHSDEKPHVCNTCGRAFKELSTLHNHERIHSGEKPFKCETCGKCFRQRVSYLVHRRIHTGSMPYQCTACAKSFRYKVSQRTHKCTAQPPGQVIRQSGELLQKLLLNSSLINGQDDPEQQTMCQNEAEERHRIDALIDKSIEDMTKGKGEHINLNVEEILGIGITGITAQDHQLHNGPVNSPTDQFQSLCLYSDDKMESLNEDTLKDLLYTSM